MVQTPKANIKTKICKKKKIFIRQLLLGDRYRAIFNERIFVHKN